MSTKKVCTYCGSDDVGHEAFVRWSEEKQDWEPSTIYDDGICNACGAEGDDVIVDDDENDDDDNEDDA